MRVKRYGNAVRVWYSAKDTYDWAHRPDSIWPCSTLSDKRVFAEFQDGNLIDLRINGKYTDCDGNEFNALIEDTFGSVNPE